MDIEAIGLGEILVDLIPIKSGSYEDGTLIEMHFGGAPANVIVGISRLGHKTAMIGAIGNDPLGDLLKNFLEKEHVHTEWLIKKKARTSIAFVTLKENAERAFFFYRKPWTNTADTTLRPEDLNIDQILKTKLIHVSGVSTIYPPLNKTVYLIMKKAYERKITISFDPNYRQDLWKNSEYALKVMNKYIKISTILTLGYDELDNMYKSRNYKFIAEKIMNKYKNINIIAIRLGEKGAYVKTQKEEIYVPAYKIHPIDTTGAGDAWTATFLTYHILEHNDLYTSVKYANASGALKCLKRGAVTAFPSRNELENFIQWKNQSF